MQIYPTLLPLTLGRQLAFPCLLWGDDPLTLGRRSAYFGETIRLLWGDDFRHFAFTIKHIMRAHCIDLSTV